MTDQERSRDAYRQAGVDYETLDAGKRNALTEALATSPLLAVAPGGGRAIDELPRRAGVRVRGRRADARVRRSRASAPSR